MPVHPTHTLNSYPFLSRFGQMVEVEFFGWKSDLLRLAESGWRFHAEERVGYDMHRCLSRIFLTHRDVEMICHIEDVDWMHMRHHHRLRIDRMLPKNGSYIIGRPEMRYQAFEFGPGPRMMGDPYYRQMDDMRFCLADILQPVDVDKLLVAREDEKTVDDLLKHILAKQAPLRQEIAERKVKENLIERPTAQLIKLTAA